MIMWVTKKLSRAYQLIVGDLWSTWRDHEPPRCCCNCCCPNITADHHIAEEQPATDQRLLWITWRPVHNIEVWRIKPQRRGWQAVSNQVNPQQLNWYQCLGHAKCRSQEDWHHLANVGRNQIANKLLHVVVDRTALLHCGHNRWEIVVGKDHFRGRLGNGSPRTHRNTNLGFLQCWSIIYTITSLLTQYHKIIPLVCKVSLLSRCTMCPIFNVKNKQPRFSG